MADKHDHTPEEERRIREAALDETISESFPSSDPPSSLPNPDEHDTLGFSAAREKIADFQRGLARLGGPLSFEELFTPDFMRRHTDFEDMEAMVAASGCGYAGPDDRRLEGDSAVRVGRAGAGADAVHELERDARQGRGGVRRATVRRRPPLTLRFVTTVHPTAELSFCAMLGRCRIFASTASKMETLRTFGTRSAASPSATPITSSRSSTRSRPSSSIAAGMV